MISSMHTHPGINLHRDDKKPRVIEDYNHGKGGVDVLDARIEDFTCKRMTRRYPLIFFFLLLDVALVNSYILMRESRQNYSLDRKAFIKKVADSLASGNLNSRFNTPRVFCQIQNAFDSIGMCKRLAVGPAGDDGTRATNKVGKCRGDSGKCRKPTRHRCNQCKKYICGNHKMQIVLCESCTVVD